MENKFWANLEYSFGDICPSCKDIFGKGCTESEAIKNACMLFLRKQQLFPNVSMEIKSINIRFILTKEYRRSLGLE